jgi:hypothetical protein
LRKEMDIHSAELGSSGERRGETAQFRVINSLISFRIQIIFRVLKIFVQ